MWRELCLRIEFFFQVSKSESYKERVFQKKIATEWPGLHIWYWCFYMFSFKFCTNKLARHIPFTKPSKSSCTLFAVVMIIKVVFKHKTHNVLQLITVEPTMPSQPDINEESHQEVNTDHKILSTCPSSVLGLMTKETGKGVSNNEFAGISCWMINTPLENATWLVWNAILFWQVVTFQHCLYALQQITAFQVFTVQLKTDPASISKGRTSRILPVPQASPAQTKSGLYFLIKNKLNARRWVKTPLMKMVGTIIYHQSVPAKLSFWLRQLREEVKRNPKQNKTKTSKKERSKALKH